MNFPLLQAAVAANPFAEHSWDYPLLSIVIFLPLFGALVIAAIPRENDGAIKGSAIFFSIVTFLVSLLIWRHFKDVVGFQMVERLPWVDGGIEYAIGVDGISLLLVMLTTFLTPLTLLSSTRAITKRAKEFVMCMLFLETAMLGTLLSMDMFLFYVFWEGMLIPMYLLIGVWGGKDRIYATTKFFIYTMVGSVLMLVGIIYLYLKAGGVSSSLSHIIETLGEIPRTEQLWLFGAFGLAFAIKVPIFPFHTWLPDAHTEAPTAGSVILAGVLLKLGTYGLLRFAFPLFPEAVGVFSKPIIILAVIGIIYGALVAYSQKDVKRLVAYSSVSHLGFVILGMFALTQASVEGALLQMVNHGLSTGGLFLCVGILYERRHTRLIADYGGIAKQLPIFAIFFMIMTLSSIGLPGTNGFVGEFLILAGSFQEAFQSHFVPVPVGGAGEYAGLIAGADLSASTASATNVMMDISGYFGQVWDWIWQWRIFMTIAVCLATLGVVFGAIYMLSMFRRVMFGPLKNEKNKSLKDVSGREITYLVPIAALVFIMGFFPNIFLSKMHRSVDAFIQNVRPRVQQVRTPETVEARKALKNAREQVRQP
jgi:NADH-quinone oxidoreductase subunit M